MFLQRIDDWRTPPHGKNQIANSTQSVVGHYPDRQDVALGACDSSEREPVRFVQKVSSDGRARLMRTASKDELLE